MIEYPIIKAFNLVIDIIYRTYSNSDSSFGSIWEILSYYIRWIAIFNTPAEVIFLPVPTVVITELSLIIM